VTVRDVLGHAELRTTNRYLYSKIDAAAIVAVNAAFGVSTRRLRRRRRRRDRFSRQSRAAAATLG
jgi:hypothetical protein